MYITKIDNYLDKMIDKLYIFLRQKKVFEEITKDINFVTYQDYILNTTKSYVDSIDYKELKKIIKQDSNCNMLVNVIKRYSIYYIYLGLSYYYKSGRDLFITNIIETSKNQKDGIYTIENFFNSENNAKLISFFNDIKNIQTLYESGKTWEKILLIIKNNPIKYQSTLDLFNELGDEFVTEHFLVDDNFHNIIKTIIFKMIYLKEEKQDVIRILEEKSDDKKEYMYLDVVYSKSTKLTDFLLIKKFVESSNRKINPEDIYDFLEEYMDDEEFNLKKNRDFVNYLLVNNIVVPITEDFLRYHKDTQKYEKDELIAQEKVKERDTSKIKVIINNNNIMTNYYSDIYEKNPNLKLKANKLIYKQLDYRNAVLYNNNEELKIMNKLRDIKDLDSFNLLMELENIRRYNYINYKQLSKDGFKFRPQENVEGIRYTNIKSDRNKKIESRMSNDDIDINIVGIIWNPTKLPLLYFNNKDLINVTELTKNENGYEAFVDVIKKTFSNEKQKLFYWLFNVKKDKIKLDSYENVSEDEIKKNIFILLKSIFELYNDLIFKQFKKDIDQVKELDTSYIDNIILEYKRNFIDFDFDTKLINRFRNYSYNKLKVYKKSECSFDSPLTRDKSKIIKLPVVKIENKEKNIIVVDYFNTKEEVDVMNVEGICNHHVKWIHISSLARRKDDSFSQAVFDFVKQYVKVNETNDYICKSCNELLKIKHFVYEGTYIKEKDTFMTTNIVVNNDLTKIDKYNKYTRTVKNIEKNLEKFSNTCNLYTFIGNSKINKLARRMVTKDVIDLILLHTQWLKTQPRERGEKYEKKYGTNPKLSNLFFFELKDDIFLTSSEDTDKFKLIKYNNVITYMMLIIISEMHPGMLSNLVSTKRCNFFLFDKLKDRIFGNMFIRINEKEKKALLKIPLLAYTIYYFSCVLTSDYYWLWNREEKEGFNGTIQLTIIHTIVDLINTIIEANIQLGNDEKTDYLYEILYARLLDKINKVYSDKHIYDKILNESNDYIKEDKETKKISFISKNVDYITIGKDDEDYVELSDKVKCELSTTRVKSRKSKKESDLNILTNCDSGDFHNWVIEDNDLVCSKCNKSFNKLVRTQEKIQDTSTEKDNYQEIINQLVNQKLNKVLKDYCISGSTHEFDKDGSICKKCHKDVTNCTFNSKELKQFQKYIDDKEVKRQLDIINKIKKYIENYKKYKENKKEKLNNFVRDYNSKTSGKIPNYVKDFMKELTSVLGKKVKFENCTIHLTDTNYVINHDHLGNRVKDEISFFKSDGIIKYCENDEYYKRDVYYYVNRKRNVTVYYDAVSLQYIGYKDKDKHKIESDSHLIINYSIQDKLMKLGLKSDYYEMKNISERYYKKKNYKAIVKELIRLRTLNLRQIANKMKSIIYRVGNNMKDKSFYSGEEKKVINTFIKLIKSYNVNNIFNDSDSILNNIKTDDIPEIDLKNKEYINTYFMNSMNNSDTKILFFIISNLSKLLLINKNNSNLVALFIVKLIDYCFNIYNVSSNNKYIRQFDYIINRPSASVINDNTKLSVNYQDLLKVEIDEYVETDEERRADEIAEEELNSLDVGDDEDMFDFNYIMKD